MATPPDFTTGQVLTAAQMNAVGLWLIKTQTIGTAVSTVTVSSAFSADYEAYRIVVTGGSSNQSGGTNILFQLGNSSTGYYGFLTYGSYLATTVLGANQNNGTSFNHAGGADSGGISCLIDITNPFLALTTGYVCTVRYGTVYGTFVGAHGVSTSYSSFTLTAGAGTLTGGTIRVYGYRN